MLKRIYNYWFGNVNQCNVKEILQSRLKIFTDLSQEEIKKRSKLSVPRASIDCKKVTVLSIIVEAFKNFNNPSPINNFLAFDLRYYAQVNFDSMIFANVSDNSIPVFQRYSKFNQGWFILVNINKNGVKIIPGKGVEKELAKPIVIPKVGLENVECIFNISHINSTEQGQQVVYGNLKFPANNPTFSIIAEQVSGLGLDLRAASTIQENLARIPLIGKKYQFRQTLYDLRNTYLTGGKCTTVCFENIANSGMTGSLAKFEGRVVCSDPRESSF